MFEIPDPPLRRQPVFDMRRPDWHRLRAASGLDNVQFVHLGFAEVPGLVSLGFDRIRSLSLRHLRARDLGMLAHFPQLENFEVFQSETVISIDGIQALQRVRWLAFQELGPLASLEPLTRMHSIEEFFLLGGMWKNQKLLGDFAPLASLTNLRRLAITSVRGPTDLSPLLAFEHLQHLWFPTALFPVPEVARLAARYPFWSEQRPWLQRLEQDPDGCSRCGRPRIFLLLQRKKRVWCEHCDHDRLGRVLDAFESLIQKGRSPCRERG
jgi:hypothetical protein